MTIIIIYYYYYLLRFIQFMNGHICYVLVILVRAVGIVR
jgi:hypothetical protein